MKKQKKCDTSKGEVFKEMRLLVTDRLDAPPIEVSDLINQVEGAVSEGLAIPLVAFVSGSGINRQIEFMNYDPNHHKLVLPEFFMQLIRDGAERIVIATEVWFLGDNRNREWHGVMINETTPLSDIGHVAPFEGRKLGEWKSGSATGFGNLTNLFDRAWRVPDEERPVICAVPSTKDDDGSNAHSHETQPT